MTISTQHPAIHEATDSHEVIRKAVEEPGVKAVAQRFRVSAALIYKWCEPSPTADDMDGSGARNPLDRVLTLCRFTNCLGPIRWLCKQLGGFFVPNPPTPHAAHAVEWNLVKDTRVVLGEFAELLTEISQAGAEIDAAEAKAIRERWEDLKLCGETFAVACERGVYAGKC